MARHTLTVLCLVTLVSLGSVQPAQAAPTSKINLTMDCSPVRYNSWLGAYYVVGTVTNTGKVMSPATTVWATATWVGSHEFLIPSLQPGESDNFLFICHYVPYLSVEVELTVDRDSKIDEFNEWDNKATAYRFFSYSF